MIKTEMEIHYLTQMETENRMQEIQIMMEMQMNGKIQKQENGNHQTNYQENQKTQIKMEYQMNGTLMMMENLMHGIQTKTENRIHGILITMEQ